MNMTSCKTCPPGYMCPNAGSTSIQLCPVSRYCPAKTAIPPPCVNGTYGATTGLVAQGNCTVCPPGHYCTNGLIQGKCQAGYFCKANQSSPTPGWADPVVKALSNQVRPAWHDSHVHPSQPAHRPCCAASS
jgi:hypothetical protein